MWRNRLLLGIVVLAIVGPNRYRWFSICDVCGVFRRSDCRVLPFVEIPYWCPKHTIEETILSRTVARLQLVEAHEHHWQRGAGGSFFSMSTTHHGPAERTWRNVKSEEIATFLENTRQHAGEESAREWLSFVFNAQHRNRVISTLEYTRFPKSGCSSSDEYRAWRTKASDDLTYSLENPPPAY